MPLNEKIASDDIEILLFALLTIRELENRGKRVTTVLAYFL